MKNLSFKFVFITLTVFLLFSFFIYIIDISPFYFPHLPIVFTLFFTEKKVRNRITYLLFAMVLYSQFASPMPFMFLLFISLQIYFFTVSFFTSTAFDYSLTALINCILCSFIIDLNRFFYYLAFTGRIHIFSIITPFFASFFILILVYVLLKPSVDRLFIKDTWL